MMKSSSHQKLLPPVHVQYKNPRPYCFSRITNLQSILAQGNLIPIPDSHHPTRHTPHLQSMQILALFLLAVSAGALPQSSSLSPSATLAPTSTLVNSTTPHMHEKRKGAPTIGDFDNDKCKGEHLGTKIQMPYDSTCLAWQPTNNWIDIYWGDGSNMVTFYTDNNCNIDLKVKTLHQGFWESRRCVALDTLGGAENISSLKTG